MGRVLTAIQCGWSRLIMGATKESASEGLTYGSPTQFPVVKLVYTAV